MSDYFQPLAAPIPDDVQRLLRYSNLEMFLDGGGVLDADASKEWATLHEEFKDLITTYEEDE